jgi:drug/metabolite transporter (DMT)-like permease
MQVCMAAVLGSGAIFVAEPVRYHPAWNVAIAVLVTGLLATALAFTTMAWAQKYTTATRSALIFSLEPVVAWLTSWALTGEVLSLRAAGGAVLILAGILLVEARSGSARNETSGAEAAS